MSTLEASLALYGMLAVVTAAVGLIGVGSASRSERRHGAGIILASPLWPAVWAYGIWLGIRHLIKEADL